MLKHLLLLRQNRSHETTRKSIIAKFTRTEQWALYLVTGILSVLIPTLILSQIYAYTLNYSQLFRFLDPNVKRSCHHLYSCHVWCPTRTLLHLICYTFLIIRRNKRDMIKKMYIGVQVKYSLFLSDFNKTLIFPTDFRKILRYKISRKSVRWEPSCSMRADGCTHGQTFPQFWVRA